MSNSVYASQTDKTANALGSYLTASENNLLAAYALVPGAKDSNIDKIAEDLNLTRPTDKAGNPLPFNDKAVQLVAEQRYQRASQLISLFSNLLDKMDQMKQRLIQKFGQG